MKQTASSSCLLGEFFPSTLPLKWWHDRRMVGSPRVERCLWVDLQKTLRYVWCQGATAVDVQRNQVLPWMCLGVPGPQAWASISCLMAGLWVSSFVLTFFCYWSNKNIRILLVKEERMNQLWNENEVKLFSWKPFKFHWSWEEMPPIATNKMETVHFSTVLFQHLMILDLYFDEGLITMLLRISDSSRADNLLCFHTRKNRLF